MPWISFCTVHPEIVCYEENGIDAKGMDYSKITPLLVEAVKALKAENDLLKQRLDTLERASQTRGVYNHEKPLDVEKLKL